MKALHRLIAKNRNFISAQALAEAVNLQAQLDTFSRHVSRYPMDTRRNRLEAAVQIYRAAPTDCNLAAMEAVLRENSPFDPYPDGQDPISLAVNGARKAFLESAVRSWAEKLWHRAFDMARTDFIDTHATEFERVLAATGEKMTHSDILAVKAAVVRELATVGVREGYHTLDFAEGVVSHAPSLVPPDEFEKRIFEQYGIDAPLVAAKPGPLGMAMRSMTPFEWLDFFGIGQPERKEPNLKIVRPAA